MYCVCIFSGFQCRNDSWGEAFEPTPHTRCFFYGRQLKFTVVVSSCDQSDSSIALVSFWLVRLLIVVTLCRYSGGTQVGLCWNFRDTCVQGHWDFPLPPGKIAVEKYVIFGRKPQWLLCSCFNVIIVFYLNPFDAAETILYHSSTLPASKWFFRCITSPVGMKIVYILIIKKQ